MPMNGMLVALWFSLLNLITTDTIDQFSPSQQNTHAGQCQFQSKSAFTSLKEDAYLLFTPIYVTLMRFCTKQKIQITSNLIISIQPTESELYTFARLSVLFLFRFLCLLCWSVCQCK